ncbi:uncharacterized protein LOC141896614 [Acropora palmata]|uniref:uncharacterized protein LOC141896614 n=1 Tax=Acropora palmata TaxID=6131 RepID=UPI003DA078C1
MTTSCACIQYYFACDIEVYRQSKLRIGSSVSGLFVAFNAKQEFKMWHFQSLATVCLLLAVLLLQAGNCESEFNNLESAIGKEDAVFSAVDYPVGTDSSAKLEAKCLARASLGDAVERMGPGG